MELEKETKEGNGEMFLPPKSREKNAVKSGTRRVTGKCPRKTAGVQRSAEDVLFPCEVDHLPTSMTLGSMDPGRDRIN